VIRFAPPLTITLALIDDAVERFREVVLEKGEALGLVAAADACA
jgi:acetylornithine/succinyldiaminopimelate/putrescine aminotransferase